MYLYICFTTCILSLYALQCLLYYYFYSIYSLSFLAHLLINRSILMLLPSLLDITPDRLGNVFLSDHLVKSYSINLFCINDPQCLISSLNTLFVAMPSISQASFQIVTNNLCNKLCMKI